MIRPHEAVPSEVWYTNFMNPADVNRREIVRYLGGKWEAADEQMLALIEDVLAEMFSRVTPKHVFHTYPLSVQEAREDADNAQSTGVHKEEKPLVDMTCMQVRSGDLAKNLSGCTEVLLFAATLGEGADFLVRRYEKTNMSRAAVCQAAGAAMIEAYCDEINDAWRESYAAKGKRLRPRFSCGYGDFPLSYQKQFADVLQMEKRLGIRLTEGLLMVPTKSVTAVIGIGEA